MIKPNADKLRPSLAILSVAGLLMAFPASGSDQVSWDPVSSERLVRLPATYLEKAVQRDFQSSPLAGRMFDLEDRANAMGRTLAELRDAIELADGEVEIELRHQYLAEKSAYLDTMEERQELKRRGLNTKIGVFQSVLRKLKRSRSLADDPVTVDLIEKQAAATRRLENSIEQVDARLFEAVPGEESRYSEEYRQNLGRISELQQAIQVHRANGPALIGGEAVTREAYVRHLLAQAEAGLALLNQEQEMLGYMAKLVALDAQALQYELEHVDSDSGSTGPDPSRLANSVQYFIE